VGVCDDGDCRWQPVQRTRVSVFRLDVVLLARLPVCAPANEHFRSFAQSVPLIPAPGVENFPDWQLCPGVDGHVEQVGVQLDVVLVRERANWSDGAYSWHCVDEEVRYVAVLVVVSFVWLAARSCVTATL